MLRGGAAAGPGPDEIARRRDERATWHIGLLHAALAIEGKNVVIFDDVVSTGSTLVEAAEALKRAGARDMTRPNDPASTSLPSARC